MSLTFTLFCVVTPHCLAPTYKTTWDLTPEDILNAHCHENLTFDVIHLARERIQW